MTQFTRFNRSVTIIDKVATRFPAPPVVALMLCR